ncbi:MAG: response regulator transcription factor [Labilithrix sp.]|nr:response regulator transcription factor [Labilithrix sp.]MCW5811586.1 response regulator transcription factor [Labilithrix sp.]
MACILVVDSFDPTRAVTADALRQNGFTVHDVADDDEAASILAAEAVDVVLLDLPLEDTIELAAEIRRATAASRGPKIFALVDRAATPERGRARQAGVDFFLLRPCPAAALLKHLSRML